MSELNAVWVVTAQSVFPSKTKIVGIYTTEDEAFDKITALKKNNVDGRPMFFSQVKYETTKS